MNAATLDALTIDQDGCCLLRSAVPPGLLAACRDEVAESLEQGGAALVRHRSQTFGARNLAASWGGWRPLTRLPAVMPLLNRYVGQEFGLVRILYFDKPPGGGWSLPWHRDQTIAVKTHLKPMMPFSKPTTKAGIPHVEATREVLDRMLTLRLSLDPMTEENGPLLVQPGSHHDAQHQAMPHDARQVDPVQSSSVEILGDAGDVFAMRPRLLHASCTATRGAKSHRRVVHMEFAPSGILPGEWSWHSFQTS